MGAAKKKSLIYARLTMVVTFKLRKLPPMIALLDSGYDKATTLGIIYKMYKDVPPHVLDNWDFSALLFSWIDARDEDSIEPGMLRQVEFGSNWNNKFGSHNWVSIRVNNPATFVQGAVYRIHHPGNKDLGEQTKLF